MRISVDILTVLGPGDTVEEPVLKALEQQSGVGLRHYLVEGPPRRNGEERASAIARARNRAKSEGTSHYAMFLDRDVVLPPESIETLVQALAFNPHYAALGINYQEEAPPPGAVHVAMGSVLMYRSVLEKIQFRTEPGRCECYCCCVDLRRMGFSIDYLPRMRAIHLK